MNYVLIFVNQYSFYAVRKIHRNIFHIRNLLWLCISGESRNTAGSYHAYCQSQCQNKASFQTLHNMTLPFRCHSSIKPIIWRPLSSYLW